MAGVATGAGSARRGCDADADAEAGPGARLRGLPAA